MPDPGPAEQQQEGEPELEEELVMERAASALGQGQEQLQQVGEAFSEGARLGQALHLLHQALHVVRQLLHLGRPVAMNRLASSCQCQPASASASSCQPLTDPQGLGGGAGGRRHRQAPHLRQLGVELAHVLRVLVP